MVVCASNSTLLWIRIPLWKTVMLPFASAYKDVFAFAVVIAIMAWRPTGLIREKISERV